MAILVRIPLVLFQGFVGIGKWVAGALGVVVAVVDTTSDRLSKALEFSASPYSKSADGFVRTLSLVGDILL